MVDMVFWVSECYTSWKKAEGYTYGRKAVSPEEIEILKSTPYTDVGKWIKQSVLH